jgi:enterochelin esterase-like enzyme
MRNFILSVVVFLLACSNTSAQEQLLVMEGCSMHSKLLNKEVKYSVCLPGEYYDNDKKSYPVTYLLHGLGDDHSGWLEYGAPDIFLKRNIENGNSAPMILIMPDAFNTYYVNDYAGTFLYEDMFIKELVPHIDSVFRTINNSGNRALVGYSMGGFGAMMLHIKHPDIFGCTVPLSMSVRTDEQYMTEDASGWDGQWGRLFGRPGLKGSDRITDYYRKNSPFHIFPTLTSAEKSRLKIFMLNGDDEGTLCRSNEELHILMTKLGVPHEYRVVNGGHSFRVWRDAMPYALRYISDFFNSREYAGDYVVKKSLSIIPGGDMTKLNSVENPSPTFNQLKITDEVSEITANSQITGVFVPGYYKGSNRQYPIIMIHGKFDSTQQYQIANKIYSHKQVIDNCPVIVAFFSAENIEEITDIFKRLEDVARIRDGRKYRSLICSGGDGYETLKIATGAFPVNVVALFNNQINHREAESVVNTFDKEMLSRLRIFIDTPDKGNFIEGNGAMHMLLRDIDHNHEYRVRESLKYSSGSEFDNFNWMIEGINEPLDYIILNFHG